MAGSKLVERAQKKAHEYEKLYSGCSQSVLGALQEELEIGGKDSFTALSALAGGVARQGETCGAVIGALAALGLVIGRDRIEDTPTYRAAMQEAMQLRNSFLEELKRQFGLKEIPKNTLCRHIQKRLYDRPFNLARPADFQAFLDIGGHGDNGCPKVCGVAARVAAEAILKIRDEKAKE